MTRDFILTWAPKFTDHLVRVDPVGLKDWCSPLGMVQWVVGHAVYGQPMRWNESRRDDCVTVMGVAGRWEGLLYHQPFIILDTLFAARPEPKLRNKKIERRAAAQFVQNIYGQQAPAGAAGAGGVYQAQADVWVQVIPGVAVAPMWVDYHPQPPVPVEPVQDE